MFETTMESMDFHPNDPSLFMTNYLSNYTNAYEDWNITESITKGKIPWSKHISSKKEETQATTDR